MSSLHVEPRERSANIFINYRREDSAGHAGRLFDALSGHFAGRLFMDVDTLEPGVDFVEAIEQAVGSCEALIVVIGREWLTIEDRAGHRRLDDPGDFVRLEVESALARRIRVIPVLVEDALMPRAEELPASLARLARRNAIELSDARWAYDVDRLARTIQDILKENLASGPAPAATPEKATPPPAPVAPAVAAKATGSRVWLFSLAALVLVAAVVLGSLAWIRRTLSGNDDPPAQVQVANLEAGAVPASGVAIGAPASGGPTANPAGGVNSGKSVPTAANDVSLAGKAAPGKAAPAAASVAVKEQPRGVQPVRRDEPSATSSSSIPEAEAVTIPSGNEPARSTILSPRNGETVGSDILVQGIVFGLVDQQAFLAIRQKNGAIYPRGEVFPNADGQWSIKLKSSKEKTFEILVVASASKEATQVLRDQRSRDDGLSVLPGGAAISSGVVTLKKQGKIRGILNPKRPDSSG